MLESRELAGKVAVVTGGSRGIGAAISRRLAFDGARVAVNYSQSREAAEKVVAEIEQAGGSASAFICDLSKADAIQPFFEEVEDTFGRPDILINNAATREVRSLREVTCESYETIFGLNVLASLLCSAEMAKRMNDGGHIIYITSGAARLASGGNSLYAGSKAALEAFARCQAVDLGPRGVTVNAVAPGPTDTSMLPEDGRAMAARITSLGRVGSPEDLADVISLLCSHRARWITGKVIDADGGLHFF